VVGAFIVISNFQDYISKSLQIPFLAPNPVDFLLEAGLVLVLCAVAGVVSSLYPAFRSSRLDPYSVIREGESC
jgi:ABC-type lipoprotein release transport system permease subunit